MLEASAKRRVMSQVPGQVLLALTGMMEDSVQVWPPSWERKMGTRLVAPEESRVNAVAAIWRGLAGLTAMFGSRSSFTSLLLVFGIRFTTITVCAEAVEAATTKKRADASSKFDFIKVFSFTLGIGISNWAAACGY